MDSTEMGLRVRIAIKETTAGYLEANYEYKAIDSARNFAIQLALAKERMAQEAGQDYKSPLLMPLIALDTLNTTTIGSGYQEYNLPSTYLGTYIALYSYSNAGTQYPCAIVSFAEAVKRSNNAYANSFKTPLVYTKAEKLGFMPQAIGAGANNYTHYYYSTQTAISTTGQDLVLREETHEALIEGALYYVHLEKREYDKAQIHLNNFITRIQGLI